MQNRSAIRGVRLYHSKKPVSKMFTKLLKRFRKRKELPSVSTIKSEAEPQSQPLPPTSSNIVSNLPPSLSSDVRISTNLSKSVPLLMFPGPMAIDKVLANLPCKAVEIPNQNVRNALREFEDAYVTKNQQRRTTARAKLLASLPFESDSLNENLKSALKELHDALGKTPTPTQNETLKVATPLRNQTSAPPSMSQPNSKSTHSTSKNVHTPIVRNPEKSDSDSTPSTINSVVGPEMQVKSHLTSKSVITFLDLRSKGIAEVESIVDHLKTEVGKDILSTNFRVTQNNTNMVILYVNCASAEVANRIVSTTWKVAGRKIRFKLEIARP